jgi:hypothetical protein
MLVEQAQRSVNSLDKDIVDLEKKKVAKDKECADLQKKITTAQKSTSKTSSQATLRSKLRQIAGWEADLAKKSKDSADLGKKIADKKKKRAESSLKLQKEERSQQKKDEKKNKAVLSSYQSRIDELQGQLRVSVAPPNVPAHDDEPEEYDVFVSHAFEDKEDFVDELVAEMRKLDLKVWYDTDKLKWGDSMREKIDRGLSKSRYGIVVLSPNYIAEQKYWTKAELNGLFQVETINGKTILPIWHNLTKKQVVEYSPIIADRKAMTTASMTAEEIANELKDLFVTTEGNDE